MSTLETDFETGEEKGPVQFAMITQYVKDLSFENPRAPESIRKMQEGKPDIKINVNINARKVGEEGFDGFGRLLATKAVLHGLYDRRVGRAINQRQTFLG